MAFIDFNSEKEIKDDLHWFFKYHRGFEQKAMYFTKGADIFYQLNQLDKPHVRASFNWEKNYEVLKRLITKKQNENSSKIDKTAIISLGCGNGCREKEMLAKLHEEIGGFDYLGIDSSNRMLELAKENLKDEKYNRTYIFGDIGNENLHEKLKDLVKDYSNRIFLLLGNTLGNVPQSYIGDILRNMLVKGDFLWVDVSIRKDLKESTSAKIFERYLNYIADENAVNFISYPLSDFNISKENGELELEMENYKSLNSLNFIFKFVFKKITEVNIDGEISTFLPNDVICLHTIMVYDVDSLVSFFEFRNFEFFEKLVLNNKAQIIFRKK